MTIEEIKRLVQTEQYDFLRTDEHLGKNIVLLTLGGSHAYGMEQEGSDVDIRGMAANSKREILLGTDFEHVVERVTDTTVYSLKKIVGFLKDCNPNTIEMLGCKPEHYLVLTEIGKSMIENRDMFLSQRAVQSFGGYAESQLRRMESKSVDSLEQKRREEHILKSINRSREIILDKYQAFPEDRFNMYIEKAVTDGLDAEIFVDMSLTHYPMRDLKALLNEFGNIISSYSKLGTRNNKAFLHQKVGKHSAHLLRLYMMGIDILEKGEINTYRVAEHDLLMKARNKGFLNEEGVPSKEFYDIVNEYSQRMDYAAKHTILPIRPDQKRIDDWLCWANNLIMSGHGIQ